MADIGSKEDADDAQILHEATAEAKKRETGECEDVSDLSGDLEAEGELEANTRTFKQARTVMVETSDFELEEQPNPKRATPTMKSKRAKTSKFSKPTYASQIFVGAVPLVGRKKQKTSSKCILS